VSEVPNASVRRSPFLVAYWQDRTHTLYNYATRRAHEGGPLASAVLDVATRWTHVGAIRSALPQWDGEAVDRTVADLAAHDMLERADRPPSPEELAMDAWAGWNPFVGFFHRATQGWPFAEHGQAGARGPVVAARPHPEMVKTYPGRAAMELPVDFASAPIADLLGTRRTWRASPPATRSRGSSGSRSACSGGWTPAATAGCP
jgi:hypothetical protein